MLVSPSPDNAQSRVMLCVICVRTALQSKRVQVQDHHYWLQTRGLLHFVLVHYLMKHLASQRLSRCPQVAKIPEVL